MLYSIPQFQEYQFLIDLVPTEQASSYKDKENVIFLNPKLILSTNILFSAIYKNTTTFKYTNTKLTDTNFIRDLYINLLAVTNVKKLAFDLFSNDPNAEKCLKIELLNKNENEKNDYNTQDLNLLSEELLEMRDLDKIKEIYGTPDETKINEFIQMRGL